MRKLLLHIGCHKTGTSSIQKNLKNQKEVLIKSGWELISPHIFLRQCHLSGNANSYVNIKGEKDNLSVKIKDKLYTDLKKNNNNIIMSAEELSWIFSEEEIIDFHKNLSGIFSEIKVVIYFRRQDKQLVSHYQQGFRAYDSSAAKFYGRELRAVPEYLEYFDYYYDYESKYNLWADAFGSNNIIVRWFDKETLIGQDASLDFFHVANLTISKEELISCNEGLTLDEMIINNILYDKFGRNYYLIDEIKSKINLLNSNEKFPPCRHDMEIFYNRYHQSNLSLIDKVFSDMEYKNSIFRTLVDFNMYPVDNNNFDTTVRLYNDMVNNEYFKLGKIKTYYKVKSLARLAAKKVFN
ncbi:hypothetical protein AB6C79_09755 [Vibrio splendidus]